MHGLYTASLISTVIGMYLPGPGAVYLSQTLNFRAPVKIGDVITVIVEVVELIEKGRRAKLKCECLVDGKVVLDGEAIVMVPSREQAIRAAAARPTQDGTASSSLFLAAFSRKQPCLTPRIPSSTPATPPLRRPDLEGAVVALGNFDGLHAATAASSPEPRR